MYIREEGNIYLIFSLTVLQCICLRVEAVIVDHSPCLKKDKFFSFVQLFPLYIVHSLGLINIFSSIGHSSGKAQSLAKRPGGNIDKVQTLKMLELQYFFNMKSIRVTSQSIS